MIQIRRTADHDSLIFEVVVREGKGVADRGWGLTEIGGSTPGKANLCLSSEDIRYP